MILNPAIIALLGGGFLVSAFAIYASVIGLQIIRFWDIQSGSELQLKLERKTYLISTIFNFLLVFEFAGIFLFIYTTDHIHDLFIGAMCAAGSLNVNDFGYATLVIKIATFMLCGVWVILNYADNRGYDYPLVRSKYKLLTVVTGALVLENLLQSRYFLGLRADVITSCCGTLFSEDTRSISGEMASLPPYGSAILFYLAVALTLRTGIHFLVTRRAAGTFALFAAGTTLLGFVSVVSFISVYYYELPTHHCPFCILQREYHYIGYPLYFSLLLAGISGMGVGVMERFKGPESLRRVMPPLQRRLTMISLVSFMVFAGIAAYPMVFSDFILNT